jgi:GSH-dependent disulfide-bond oxidoreductase
MPMGSPDFRSAEFLSINPNGKIPAIRHHESGRAPVTIFESGAILFYLADSFGGLEGATAAMRGQTLSWLFLQVAGLGPMMGNAADFRAMKSPDPYTIGRFHREASRYLNLVEARLSEVEWLNGESYSIADIAHFSWIRSAAYAPALQRSFREKVRLPHCFRQVRAFGLMIDEPPGAGLLHLGNGCRGCLRLSGA